MHHIRSFGAIFLVLTSVLAQFNKEECGKLKGCHIPDPGSCPESCRGMGMSWRLIDDDTLELELFTNSNKSTGRYVAVGFSDDEKMGGESVIECSSLGNEPASMKFSYDKPNGKGNLRIDGDFSSHFFDTKISFENGVFYCKSKVRVVGDENNQNIFKYDPSKFYHLLLVNGMTKPNGLIHHHPKQDSVTRKISLRDIGSSEVDLSSCGAEKGCVAPIGEACYGIGVGMGATYKLVSDDKIEFEIYGPVKMNSENVYVALGFANTTNMNYISVLECSKFANESNPTLKFSYNNFQGNERIEGEQKLREKYIQLKASRMENGKIYCNGIVNVSGDEKNQKIFKWDKNRGYNLLFATGITDDKGLTHHIGDCSSSSKVFLDQTSHFDTDECGVTKACFIPDDCDGGCDDMKASWKVVGTKVLEIELESKTNGSMNRYIAMGFSENSKMANASVIDCSSFNNAQYSLAYSFNTDSPNYDNLRSSEDELSDFSKTTIQHSENVLYCKTTVKVDGSSNDPAVFEYQENQKYSVILASGSTLGKSLQYHDKRSVDVSRLLTDLSPNSNVSSTTSAPNGDEIFDQTTCESEKGCFMPDSTIVASYRVIDDKNVEIEVSAAHSSADGVYAAVGFSGTQDMGPAQVIECSSLPGQSLSMKFSYNENSENNIRIKGEELIKNTESSFVNGKIYCRGTVSTGDGSNDEIFKYQPDREYYLVLAKGNSKSGGLSYHGPKDRFVSSARKLTDYSEMKGSGNTVTLLILHAIFMTVAWMILVPTAVIFARVLRSSWPTTKPFGLLIWFHVHRSMNIIGIGLMIAGFVLILVQKNWKFVIEGWGGKHAIIGIISLILAWLQPFISSLRCSPNDPRRPYFNYIHRGIGVTSMALATTTICIAGYHFTPTRNFAQLILALVPITVLLAVSIFFVVFNSYVKVDIFTFSSTQRVEDIPMEPSSKSAMGTTWSIRAVQTRSERSGSGSEMSSERSDIERRRKMINKFREVVVYISVSIFIAVGIILSVFFGTSFS